MHSSKLDTRPRFFAGFSPSECRNPANMGYSASGLRVHFGVGVAEKLDEVRILWPSGRKSVLRGVAVNRVLGVREPAQ